MVKEDADGKIYFERCVCGWRVAIAQDSRALHSRSIAFIARGHAYFTSDVYERNQWMDPRIDESRLDAFGTLHAHT